MKVINSQNRRETLKKQARQLLVELWKNYFDILGVKPTASNFFPVRVDLIASEILNVSFEEPEEIESLAMYNDSWGKSETAGYINRRENKIVVAQKFKPEWRLFTAAHEIGHWLLHKDIDRKRERPLNGGERADYQRPPQEKEADIFAAELLMPTKYLTDVFFHMFGECIEISGDIDSKWSFILASELNIDEFKLVENGVRYQALNVAQMNHFNGREFIPLSRKFGVSATAMAIRLEELGLVK